MLNSFGNIMVTVIIVMMNHFHIMFIDRLVIGFVSCIIVIVVFIIEEIIKGLFVIVIVIVIAG
jgi:hypothetical protein